MIHENNEADPLVISDDTGQVIFRLRGDGSAVMPDPAKAKLAAAIFWREVLVMARTMGIPVAFVWRDAACENCQRPMRVQVEYTGPVLCSDHAPIPNTRKEHDQ